MTATITINAAGRIEDAEPEALALLGVTLDELLALPQGAFSPDPPDLEADAAFRTQWEADGRPDIGGQATLQRPDGSKVRVRFAITQTPDERFLAVLEPIAASVDAPTTMYTGGEVLAAWRAAERRLTALEPDSQEWADASQEIERFRSLYHDLFKQKAG
jgi:PAS domain-containing protein